MRKVRFGIIGAGKIAKKFVQAVQNTDCAQIVAVASKTPERAEEFARLNDIESFCDYETLVGRSDIDAVYIATTHNFHYENIKLCLDAGKHVLCEKPMVLTEKDASELFESARSKGLFLMEAMWTRFLPSMRKAKQWIEEGRIGKIQTLSGMIAFKGNEDPENRLINASLAGGALYDVGVYMIEIASFLAGEHITDAVGKIRRDHRTGVDVVSSFILSFETVDASLQCLVTSDTKEYFIVSGDAGYIEIPRSHVSDECFLYGEDMKLTEHFKQEFPEGNGFVYEIEETVRCINSGMTESEIMPAQATVECARVFEKLLSD